MDLVVEESVLLYLLYKRLKSNDETSHSQEKQKRLKSNEETPQSHEEIKGLKSNLETSDSHEKEKRLKKKCKQKRRIRSQKIVHLSGEASLFINLYKKLRSDSDKFFAYLRMSIPTFDELLGYLKDFIKKQDTLMRVSITPEERLVITLRYLATGCSLAELHSTFGVGKSTASKIVREVTACIWSVLAGKEIPPLNCELFLEISQGFQGSTNFPHCIGAIDGKHIRMVQPDNSGPQINNHKDFFSVVLLAMCDSDCKFTYIEVGSYDESSDPRIFRNSTLQDNLIKGSLDIPPASHLDSEEELLPYVILGDEGFAMSENLLRPYGGKDLSEVKKNFNSRLARARQCSIGSAFEIMVNKWRIFRYPLNVRLDLAENIVRAACVLHNFVLRRDGRRNGNSSESSPRRSAMFDIDDDSRSRPNPKVINIRDRFAEYFVNNPLERQNGKI